MTGRARHPNERLRQARGDRSQAELAELANAEIQRRTGRVGTLSAKSISQTPALRPLAARAGVL